MFAHAEQPVPAGLKRGREHTLQLTTESSHDNVLQWLQAVLGDDVNSNTVLTVWGDKGERPDGQVLLNCSEQDLEIGLHLKSHSIRKKVWGALSALKPRAPLGAIDLNITPEGPAPKRPSPGLKSTDVEEHPRCARLSGSGSGTILSGDNGKLSGTSLSGRRTRRGTLIAPETPAKPQEPEPDVEAPQETVPVELFDTSKHDVPYQLVFDPKAARDGMKFLLYTMSRLELCQVVSAIPEYVAGVSTVRMCVPRKRDPITGERRTPFPVNVEQKPLADNIFLHLESKVETEIGTRHILQRLANRIDLLDVMQSYIATNFTSAPPANTAGEVVSAIMKLWTCCSVMVPPTTCLLGKRTISLTGFHMHAKQGVRKEGRVGELLRYFEKDMVRLSTKQGDRKIKKMSELKNEIINWLRNADLLVAGQVSANYKISHTRLEVLLTMKRHTVGERVGGSAGGAEAMETDAPRDGPEGDAARERAQAAGGCDLMLLLSRLDHLQGSPAIAAMKLLKEKIDRKDVELFAQGVAADPAGEDGCVSNAQFHDLLNSLDSATYPLPEGLEQSLASRLNLPLKPFQKQAVAFMMREEASAGSGRHLWVELPAELQEPCQVVYEHEVQNGDSDASGDDEAEDMEEDNGSDDELDRGLVDDFADDEVVDMDEDEEGSQETATPVPQPPSSQPRSGLRSGLRSGGSQPRSDAQDGADADDFQRHSGGGRSMRTRRGATLGARLEEAAEQLPAGPRPAVRIFYSPLLNMIVWHNSMKKLEAGVGRLALGNTRGGYCCLAVGMGKTATMLALSRQPLPESWNAYPPDWSQDLLFDGHTGHRSNLPHGPTLVVAPLSILAQWEIEFAKFMPHGCKLMKFHSGTHKRPLTPGQLAERVQEGGIDLVITTPDIAIKDLALLKGVHWLRVIVDEAHQVPKLLESLVAVPAHAKWLVTGTPVGDGSLREDLKRMLDLQHLPQYNLLARRPRDLGFVLHGLMVRYTMQGMDADGNPHLVLPPLNERTVEVPWSEQDKVWYEALHAEHKSDFDQYIAEVTRNKEVFEEAREKQQPCDVTANECRPNHFKILKTFIEPLQRACAGGMSLFVSDPPEHDLPMEEEEDGPLLANEFGEGASWTFTSKLHALLQDLRELKAREPHSKVLIFSRFKDTLKGVKSVLAPVGFQFRTLSGDMTLKARAQALQDFQYDPPTTVFLLTAQSAAVGLTLTAASHVYLMEPSLNIRQELQAIGRAHRMGQEQPVTVTRLVMAGSVEMRMRELVLARSSRGDIDKFCVDAHDVKRFRLKPGRKGLITKGDMDNPDVDVVAAAAKTEELMALLA